MKIGNLMPQREVIPRHKIFKTIFDFLNLLKIMTKRNNKRIIHHGFYSANFKHNTTKLTRHTNYMYTYINFKAIY